MSAHTEDEGPGVPVREESQVPPPPPRESRREQCVELEQRYPQAFQGSKPETAVCADAKIRTPQGLEAEMHSPHGTPLPRTPVTPGPQDARSGGLRAAESHCTTRSQVLQTGG